MPTHFSNADDFPGAGLKVVIQSFGGFSMMKREDWYSI